MAMVKDICDPFALYGPGVNKTVQVKQRAPVGITLHFSARSLRSAAVPGTETMTVAARAAVAVRPDEIALAAAALAAPDPAQHQAAAR